MPLSSDQINELSHIQFEDALNDAYALGMAAERDIHDKRQAKLNEACQEAAKQLDVIRRMLENPGPSPKLRFQCSRCPDASFKDFAGLCDHVAAHHPELLHDGIDPEYEAMVADVGLKKQ